MAPLLLYNFLEMVLNKINFYGHHHRASDGFFEGAVTNWLLNCGDKYFN